jgi:antirestriction protein ArdC
MFSLAGLSARFARPSLLGACDVEIRHDQADQAFYRPATDRIHLPGRESFPSADAYFSTALHELGHATGHPSRLGRDLAHPFGSEGYAKEELRAEIASLIMGDELGIGHDPGQHAAYVGSWIKILKDDPKEILRASRDAEQIHRYVTALEKGRVLPEQEVTHKDTIDRLAPTKIPHRVASRGR